MLLCRTLKPGLRYSFTFDEGVTRPGEIKAENQRNPAAKESESKDSTDKKPAARENNDIYEEEPNNSINNNSYSDNSTTYSSMPGLIPRRDMDSSSDESSSNQSLRPRQRRPNNISMAQLQHLPWEQWGRAERQERMWSDSTSDSSSSYMPSLIAREDSSVESTWSCTSDESLSAEEDDTDYEEVNVVITEEEYEMEEANSIKAHQEGIQRSALDTGATSTFTSSTEGLINKRKPLKEHALFGNGSKAKITMQGDLVRETMDGRKFILKNVQVCPDAHRELISLQKMMDDGWKVEFQKEKALLIKAGVILTFFRKNNLYQIESRPASNLEINETTLIEPDDDLDEAPASTPTEEWKEVTVDVDAEGKTIVKKKKIEKIDINEAHDRWNHKGEQLLRKTAKHHTITLTGELKSCEGCAYSKAKQKNVAKKAEKRDTVPGEMLHFDGSGPFPRTLGGNQYVYMAIDDATSAGFAHFCAHKDKWMKWLEEDIILAFKGLGKPVKIIRADNAGENVKWLKQIAVKNGIKLELTASNTPQQNGKIERFISLTLTRANASLCQADFNKNAKAKFWGLAVQYNVDTHNVTNNSTADEPPYTDFNNKASKLIHYLQPFGRIGYSTIRKKFQGKWKEKSIKGIFVGYPRDHSGDAYKMYNPKTNKVYISRDITWADWKRPDPKRDLSFYNENKEAQAIPAGVDNTDDDDIVIVESNVHDYSKKDNTKNHPTTDTNNNNPSPTTTTTVANPTSAGNLTAGRTESVIEDDDDASQVPAGILKPSSHAEIDSSNQLDDNDTITTRSGNKVCFEPEVHYVFNTESASDFGEPKTFEEAMNSPQREQWQVATKAEFMNFINRESWVKHDREKALALGKTIIGTKLVFKIKTESDGSLRFKVRAVALGFMQKKNIDYLDSVSPVCTQSSVNMGIGMALYNQDKGWTIALTDIEAAFLETKIPYMLFLEWPKGVVELGLITEEERKKYVIQQVGGIYGCVDTALRFFVEYRDLLTDPKGMGMTQSKADPCVFFKKVNGEVKLIAMLHVDDTLLVGPPEEFEWFKKGVSKRFKYTFEDKLKKHLGVWYEWQKDENGNMCLIATMPTLVEEIINKAETMSRKFKNKPLKLYDTPGAPGDTFDKNKEDPVEQEEYRSIVGKAMYLVTKIWAEGANTTRELTRHFSNPGQEHWDGLFRMAGYLQKYKEEIKLIYKKPLELRPGVMIDSSYAPGKYDRKSISGALFTLGGMLVHYFSKTQSIVVLSSTEAEFLVFTPAVQEILFQLMILDEWGVAVKPAIILEDNEATIALIKNSGVGQRTKHIDIRYRFCKQHYPQSFYPIHVGTKDNDSDALTKHQSTDLFQTHSKNIRECNLHIKQVWWELVKQVKAEKAFHLGRMSE